jgi:hypothetical protein
MERELQSRPDVVTVYYEDYYQGQDLTILDQTINIKTIRYIETIATELPYKEICSNYQEVEEKIKHDISN